MISPVHPRRRQLSWWLWRGAGLGLLIWIVVDVFIPVQHSIRQFDAREVARLETAMWRSYYDKNPVLLFWQLAGGLRQQFHAPFWRSFGLAYRATEAAFLFKKGQSKTDYQRALPTLVTYYEAIQDLTIERFNAPKVAAYELNWWIVHRERSRYSYEELSLALVQTAAALYNQPATSFTTYGRQRAEAMRLCDLAGQQPGGATEVDWEHIERELNRAWSTLHNGVQPK